MNTSSTCNKLLAMSLFIFLGLLSCKDDDNKPENCSKTVELGLFTADFDVPYDSLENISFNDEIGDFVSGTVNHPSDFTFLLVKQLSNEKQTYNCELLNSVEKYEWEIESKQSIISIDFQTGGSKFFMLKQTPVVNPIKPQDGPIGVFIGFYGSDPFSGALNTESFMSIMTEEIQSGQGAAYEFGYTLLGNITIIGENFEQVYTNTAPLIGPISNIYYTLDRGLIGFKDKDNSLWKLN